MKKKKSQLNDSVFGSNRIFAVLLILCVLIFCYYIYETLNGDKIQLWGAIGILLSAVGLCLTKVKENGYGKNKQK